MRRFRILAPAVGLGLVATLAFTAAAPASSPTATHRGAHASMSETSSGGGERLAFRNAMRKLWEDHVTWTRLAIISLAHDLPDVGPTVDRLLRNQDDIGAAIGTFYGDEAGDQLAGLLHEHIGIAAELITAAKAGDDAAVSDASRRWYVNANRIARFLHRANPDQWPFAEMRSMMREHLDLTLTEAVHRLQGDYEADVADYDAVHDAILEMADMLSAGIIAQFPGRFS
jgi:hypothetical protein